MQQQMAVHETVKVKGFFKSFFYTSTEKEAGRYNLCLTLRSSFLYYCLKENGDTTRSDSD